MSTSTPAHLAPAGQPGSRRIGTLSAALRGTMAVGRVTRAEVAGLGVVLLVAVVTALLPLPWVAQLAVTAAVGTYLGTEVARRAIPAPTRRALEAFGFLGEWELARARAIGVAPIASPDDAARYLAVTPERPEDRWVRWELLLLTDRPEEAAAVAQRIPDGTAYERFERAYALDRIAWSRGGSSDIAGLRALVGAIEPSDGDDRRHAEVALAVAASQELASAGHDPLPPLLAARDRLPTALGLGGAYVASLKTVVLVAAVVLAVVAPAALTLVRALLGARV